MDHVKPRIHAADTQGHAKPIKQLANEAKSSKKGFRAYTRNVFENSYIPAIADLVKSKSCCKKAFKSVIFIAVSILCVYQILCYMSSYLQYSSIQQEFVSRPFYVEHPGITICNRNIIRRSEKCKNNPKLCKNVDEKEFCAKYPRSCPDKKKPLAKIEDPNKESNNKVRERRGQTIKESHTPTMIESCGIGYEMETAPCPLLHPEYFNVTYYETYYATPGVCYSLFPEKKDEKRTPLNKRMVIELVLNTEVEDYSKVDLYPSIFVDVVDRRTQRNAYVHGFQLKGGMFYEANIRRITKTMRLLPPYDTNCQDYAQDWFGNGNKGPLSLEECANLCLIKKLEQSGQCIPPTFYFAHSGEPLCDATWRYANASFLENAEKKCFAICRPACYEVDYEVKFKESEPYQCDGPYDYVRHENLSEWCKTAKIKLQVNFHQLSVKGIVNHPRFAAVDVFQNVGLCLVIWLGISVLSIIDTLERVLRILFYPCISPFTGSGAKVKTRDPDNGDNDEDGQSTK